MTKIVWSFSENLVFFPEHKNHEKRINLAKSVIYRDQKSNKVPNDILAQ